MQRDDELVAVAGAVLRGARAVLFFSPMRPLVDSHTLRWLMLLWVGLFFVVVVPGHRRGVVQLPGHGDAGGAGGAYDAAMKESAAGAYCPLCVLVPSGADVPRPPIDAPVSCAICFLKANLDAPPSAVTPPEFVAAVVYVLTDVRAVSVPRWVPRWACRGRAPPIGMA